MIVELVMPKKVRSLPLVLEFTTNSCTQRSSGLNYGLVTMALQRPHQQQLTMEWQNNVNPALTKLNVEHQSAAELQIIICASAIKNNGGTAWRTGEFRGN